MPKIAPFFLYMQEKKKVLRKPNGSQYSNEELAIECGKTWQHMRPEQRMKYKVQAQKGPGYQVEKYDCTGRSISALEREKQNATNYDKQMKIDIKNWISALHDGNGIHKGVFCIVSVLTYVNEASTIIPAEVGIVKVSLEHGIIDEFNYLFDPSIIPPGWAAIALEISKESHLLPTTVSKKEVDYEDFTKKFLNFIQNDGTDDVVYCSWDNCRVIRSSLEFVNPDLDMIRLYSLPLLFSEMIRLIDLPLIDSPVLDILRDSRYDFEQYTGCQWHQTKYCDGLSYCSLGKCQRWFYIMCSTLKIEKTYKIKLISHKHKPGKLGKGISDDMNNLSLDSLSPKGKKAQAILGLPERVKKESKPVWEDDCNNQSPTNFYDVKPNIDVACEEEFPSLGAPEKKRVPFGVATPQKNKKIGIGRGRRTVD